MAVSKSPVTTDVDYNAAGKQVSFFRVPYSRNDSAWASVFVPVTVIQNGEGPTLLLTAGVHGGEYEGPVALMNLTRRLEAEQIRGRVILMPALNPPAVQAGRRLSPVDGKDLNRVFPGSPNGSVTEVIAHYIHEEVLPLCDAVVDLHAGGYSLDLIPYISMHSLADQDMHRRTRAALDAFHAPIALVIEEVSGEGLLDYAVERMGKLFLSAELGGAGRLLPGSLRIAERGVRNLLVHFELLDGDIVTAESQGGPPTQVMEVPAIDYYHFSPSPGIYESRWELGEEVQEGQVVGRLHSVTDLDAPPREIRAQRGGALIVTRGPGRVESGDTVAVLARDRG